MYVAYQYARWGISLCATTGGFVVALVSLFLGTWEWRHLGIFVGYWVAIALGISVMYHRGITHQSFRFTLPGAIILKPILLQLASSALQGSARWWSAAHAWHHRHADREGDPHSPITPAREWWRKVYQFLDAHILWIPHVRIDVEAFWATRKPDWLVDFFSRWYLLVGPVSAGVIAYAIGGGLGVAWYLAAVCCTQHATGCVNSVAHVFGRRPFPTKDYSGNVPGLAFVTWGEGLHNCHHAFPWSARFGHTFLQACEDVGWWWIRLFAFCGFVTDVLVPTAAQIRRRMFPDPMSRPA